MRVIITDFAKQEIRRAAKYIYREFGKQSKDNFMQNVRHVKRLLSENPYLGPVEPLLLGRPIVYHSVVVTSLNKMVYRIMDNRIEVVDFWDVRREPSALANQVK